MSVKVEMLIQVCVGGRPIWRKAKPMRPELTVRMTDKEYDKVLNIAVAELAGQAKEFKAREAKETVKA